MGLESKSIQELIGALMKFLAALSALILTSSLMLSVSLAETPAAKSATATTGYEVKMAEGQLHCSDCAKKVSEALKSLPEVEKDSVKVILAKQTAIVQIKPGSKVTADQIKKALESKTGYKVSTVEELKTTKH